MSSLFYGWEMEAHPRPQEEQAAELGFGLLSFPLPGSAGGRVKAAPVCTFPPPHGARLSLHKTVSASPGHSAEMRLQTPFAPPRWLLAGGAASPCAPAAFERGFSPASAEIPPSTPPVPHHPTPGRRGTSCAQAMLQMLNGGCWGLCFLTSRETPPASLPGPRGPRPSELYTQKKVLP